MAWQDVFPLSASRMDAEQERELRLVAQARAGADWALAALVARYQPPVTRYLTRLTGNPELACAQAEELFVRMERRLRGPQGGQHLRLWLLRACTEMGLEAIREPRHRRDGTKRLEGPSGPTALLVGGVSETTAQRLRKGLETLAEMTGTTRRQVRKLIWANDAEVDEDAPHARLKADADISAAPADLPEEQDALQALRNRMMRAVLAELPYGDAQCLALHLVAGLNQSEVARALGLKNSATRSRIVHGLQLFSQRFEAASASLGIAPEILTGAQSGPQQPLRVFPGPYAPVLSNHMADIAEAPALPPSLPPMPPLPPLPNVVEAVPASPIDEDIPTLSPRSAEPAAQADIGAPLLYAQAAAVTRPLVPDAVPPTTADGRSENEGTADLAGMSAVVVDALPVVEAAPEIVVPEPEELPVVFERAAQRDASLAQALGTDTLVLLQPAEHALDHQPERAPHIALPAPVLLHIVHAPAAVSTTEDALALVALPDLVAPTAHVPPAGEIVAQPHIDAGDASFEQDLTLVPQTAQSLLVQSGGDDDVAPTEQPLHVEPVPNAVVAKLVPVLTPWILARVTSTVAPTQQHVEAQAVQHPRLVPVLSSEPDTQATLAALTGVESLNVKDNTVGKPAEMSEVPHNGTPSASGEVKSRMLSPDVVEVVTTFTSGDDLISDA